MNLIDPEVLRRIEAVPQDAVFRFPLEAATLTAHRFVLGLTSEVFQAQFFGGRFKEEEVEVMDFSKDVFGLFIYTLYGKELAWDTLPLATIFGLYCLADKYLVTSLKLGILEQVVSSEVGCEDLENILRDVDGAVWEHQDEFTEAVTKPIVERLEEVERKAADLKYKVEQNARGGAPVKLSVELAAIVGTNEIPRGQVLSAVWEYIRKNKLVVPNGHMKCDEKISRVIPSNPEVRRTRSKNIVKRLTFYSHLDSHIDVAPIGKRKEVLERLAGLQGKVGEARERTEPWVEWVRRACAVGEDGMEEARQVKEDVKKERVLNSYYESDSDGENGGGCGCGMSWCV